MIQFQGGRNRPYTEQERRRLKLSDFLDTTKLPPAPVAGTDYLSRVPGWPMYANDKIGDCTCAAVGHEIQAITTYGSGQTYVPAESDIVSAYSAITGYNPNDPSTDRGAVMQDVLDFWRKTGIAGHKILGFAQVDIKNMLEVYSALWLFGHLYVGFNVPQSAMDEINSGQPWSASWDNNIIGGHAINVGRTTPGELTCVTWGQLQRIKQSFWNKYVEEAWIVITSEWFDVTGKSPTGLDMQALGKQFTALTGQPSPFPTPDPTPVPPTPDPPTPDPVPPSPSPDPTSLLQDVVNVIETWLARKPWFYKPFQRKLQLLLDKIKAFLGE